jgi:hypothetical protein
MRNFFLFLFLLGSFRSSFAQFDKIELENKIHDSLEWLANAQEKETVGDSIFRGEWPSTMGLKNRFLYLGKAIPFRDSNCFTQANVFNTLAEIYLGDSSRIEVLPMLELALPELLSYRDSMTFNFWKKLEPNIPLSRKGPHPENYLAHRPTNFELKTRFINNAADIANDADDTSTGNLALFYANKVFSIKRQIPSQNLYDSYIDRNRNNYHWFNYIHKIPRPSNAYMTWLAPEVQFKHWSFPWQVAHNLVFFLPASSCFPHPYDRYVPWGANDIDAVVNCNVLNYLAKTGQLEESQGKEGAVNLLKYVVGKERWSRAGIYYPNRFYIHYTISKVYPYFLEELAHEANVLKMHLISSQNMDGSFFSRKKVNKKDVLQSTVYSLQAMLNLKEAGVEIPKGNMDKALEFILTHETRDDKGIHWKGGVFFSGGTVVRNALYFKSDAYTTALVAQAIQKYLALFDGELE